MCCRHECSLVTDVSELTDALVLLERSLDPSAPEASGVRVIGYGEISVALQTDALPGRVVKRMSGFADEAMARRHVALVRHYVAALRACGVTVVDTTVAVVPREALPPTVAIVQPLLAPDRLVHRLLHVADDATLRLMLRRVLDAVRRVLDHTPADSSSFAVDGQLSNWWFEHSSADAAAEPVLIDVGTPFVRRAGALALDRELILAAAPRVVRPYFRRDRTVEKYQDDYFDLRTAAVDLLGNVHKEGCPQRLPVAIDAVNEWLGHDARTGWAPVTRDEVDRYYHDDAALLELYLRLRRADRFMQKRLLRRGYDFVLPGPVTR
jgi:hypothetical protein